MLFNFIEILVALLLSIPLLVISVELLITLFHKELPELEENSSAEQGVYKILMPAHNEAEIIDITLSRLLNNNVLPDSILVVADNCTDSTAEVVKKLGVNVLERSNDEHKGKGFALDYGISYLKEHIDQQPDVLIILDADCEIDSNSLNILTSTCFKESLPIQALYLMRKNANSSLKQRVAGFAWLVKNKIRPIAVNLLDLPVTLTGTGMAFPWKVISVVSVAHGNIVEDMQLGIDCTLKGFAPSFCEQAVVYSDFPDQSAAEKTQRTRWEHGHLATIVQQVPKLLKRAVVDKNWRLMGLALDIGVPPLALMVMMTLVGLSLLATFSIVTAHFVAFFIILSIFSFFSILMVATWSRFGRDYLNVKELCSIPKYMFSKLSIYMTFVFKRQTLWVRTDRNNIN